MKHHPLSDPRILSHVARRRSVLALMGAVAILSACGGGGSDVASVGSGGTGSFTVGRVAGFGSIIVNGIRFDDSNAQVRDADGNLSSRDQVRLGMVVSINGSSISPGVAGGLPSASASSLSFGSELKGPIASKTADAFVVLGQTVRITSTTVFELGIGGGLAGLAMGQVAEVYGYLNPTTNEIIATRIERENGANEYRLQGLVSGLDPVARRFNIGTLSINYTGARDVPTTLANGQVVRVRLATTPTVSAGAEVWSATRLQKPESPINDINDIDEAEIEGVVSAFTSPTSFSVNGIVVDARSAVFEDGPVALGNRVEVEGRVVNGTLVARKVEIENDNENEKGDANSEFQLTGAVSALDTTAKTFVVRGVTVSYAGTVRYDDGSEASLTNNRVIEIKGRYDVANNRVNATRIDFTP
jgi:hypothetical protein